MSIDPYREFRQAVDRPEDKIDLGRAALTIAQTEYPDLDPADFLSRIDQMAVDVTRRCPADADLYRTIAALNYVLFNQHGFHGNREDYYDPKNSFLNQVIERKTGIPITLSVLYIEVAQRAGLALHGVGFPGHFLVKYAGDGEEMIIDPFNQGEIKSREELGKMLCDLHGRNVALEEEFLQPAGKKQIIQRILANLKAIYARSSDWAKTLAVLDRLIILDPGSVQDIRDRGVVYLQLDCNVLAREDFERYLRVAPDAADAEKIREQIIKLAKVVTRLH
ncbi:MAG TPA: SirB1 family protein [Candidatus Binatia bacterium]|nr:SirB1 family protein [Candidatus Binatia bacterium]